MSSSSTILVGTSRKLNWRLHLNHAENARNHRCYYQKIITASRNCPPELVHRVFYSTKNVQRIAQRSTSATISHSSDHDEVVHVEKSIAAKIKPSPPASPQDPNATTFGQKCVLASFSALTTVFDVLTLPVYTAINQPWTKIKLNKSIKSLPVENEPMTFRALIPKAPLHQEMNDHNVNTIPQLFSRGVEKHDGNECLGTRILINESDTVICPVTLKPIKKYELGDYKWKTYREVDEIVSRITCGLTQILKLGPKDKIAIFAETREEWFMLAMAAFKKNLTIVTVFTTLANDGVIHALSETEVSTLITSEEQLPRVAEVLKKLPKINTIVCFENRKQPAETPKLPNVSFHWYNELLSCGSEVVPVTEGPTENDMAIIMFSSGSTGVPKGVKLNHKNVISGLKAAMDSCYVFGNAELGDSYIAYLPLAHVLELTSEAMSFIQGVRIGYSSANTLVDNAIGLHKDTRGDAFVLKPAVFPCVPLVLERISKGIHEKIAERDRMVQILFDYFYKYKLRWASYGYNTPLVDKIIFRRARSPFGGKLRFIVCGGAPLSGQTQEFIRTVLCCPVGMGYGMTETTSAAIVTLAYDRQVGRAGTPITCNKIRLIDWLEGGYRITDKPNPRGELLIGGDNVALGYFKRNDEDTFYTDKEGVRWVRTGDIAEVHPDNVFAIIDRKNDLVKLSNGEFISLGKIESTLKSIALVENVCVYADSTTNHVVGLIVPDVKKLEKIAKSLGKSFSPSNIEPLCQDKQIEIMFLRGIQKEAKEMKLSKTEIPTQIRLCSTPWTPESGLVTGSLKLKRTNIYKELEAKLREMRN